MVNTRYPITITSGTAFITDIKNALVAYYGDGVTIHYQSSSNLVFSCPQISSKVIRIDAFTSNSAVTMHYGDSWTSGTTIVNQVTFSGNYSWGDNPNISSTEIVLGDNFFLYNLTSGHPYIQAKVVLVAKSSAGDSLVFSYVKSTDGNVHLSELSKNVTKNSTITDFITFGAPFKSPLGSIYKLPSHFYGSAGVFEISEGVPDFIPNIFISSLSPGKMPYIMGVCFISSSTLYNATTAIKLPVGILVDLI